MKRVTLHAGAEADLRETLEYYESQRTGLGGEFRREFEAVLMRFHTSPHAFAIEGESEVRFASLRRFTYRLAFLDLEDQLWIVAVAHHRRRPRYWAERIPE